MFSNNKPEKYNEAVGVLKDIDRIGRIVIPKDFRETLKLEDKVEIVMTREGVLIRNPQYEIVKK